MGVYLINVYLTGVHLMDVHLTGVRLMGVHLIGMYLTGVYLMGVHLRRAVHGRIPQEYVPHKRILYGRSELQGTSFAPVAGSPYCPPHSPSSASLGMLRLVEVGAEIAKMGATYVNSWFLLTASGPYCPPQSTAAGLAVYTVPVNYAIQFSGPVTTFTARHVWYGVGMRSICQPDPLTGYKAVVPPPLFHQLSLHPFPLPLHFSGVSCLRPLASPTFPHPSLRARGPTGPYNEAS